MEYAWRASSRMVHKCSHSRTLKPATITLASCRRARSKTSAICYIVLTVVADSKKLMVPLRGIRTWAVSVCFKTDGR